MSKNEINVMDELNKGATMGMDAIKFVLDKVENKDLYDLLEKQYNQYKSISERICEIYPEYSTKEPHKTSIMTKAMTWYGIEMKTMVDSTDSKLAELIMQGTNMGIIEGRRLLNHKNSTEEINSLVREYVNNQEEMVENLKKFL